MTPCLRLAILTTTALAGLATIPTHGADATLARDREPVALGGAERWRLRPADANVVAPTTTSSIRRNVAAAIPEERRRVRLVYPALTEAR
ncbi:hypothetical protein [Methylobacterium trifolii]|uniref:Uncharacterized protein n=1 Tax=Methylobacterium trifolii TaxID=1003092 RepID=A0ABQ4U3G3_9HYPH|nr:hypothetical protein [Methylobacterium trifolii]GJE61981.1 hypothetical protein MPOCJGCO_4109 [Methylobacterium trifolii]